MPSVLTGTSLSRPSHLKRVTFERDADADVAYLRGKREVLFGFGKMGSQRGRAVSPVPQRFFPG